MGTNGNEWHKKEESGRAWGSKCVIMVLSNNKKISSRQAPSGAFLFGGNMQIVEKELSWLKPYANNPRDNESAVEPVANSIKEFGFKVPIVATSDGEIINGHTRFKASKLLGLEKVPVIIADDLTDEQVRAFRLADNKVSEFSEWNEDKLRDELKQLEMDMAEFGFEFTELTELLEEEKEKEQEPEIKFTEELGEESNYIVLKFDTSVDWLLLESLFDLPRVHALASKAGYERKGVGRVVDGVEFIDVIVERGGLHE